MANTALKPKRVGRYALYTELAAGGMGSVYLGRLVGPAGFSRTVAVKSLHPHLARDPEFVAMFLDEARLAARVVHPNVIPTLDVVTAEGGLFVVMEYVKGESLSAILRSYRDSETGETPPITIVATILSNVLHGLHAAHETMNERGEPLGIVHRDVSPQNVLVGIDGVARLLDFGIAKAADRLHTTEEGQIKGKIAYMPPEQLRGESVNRKADIYAAAVVLWESLTGRRLFKTETQAALLEQILFGTIAPPSSIVPGIPSALDAVVMRGLAQDRTQRFATAREMAIALQAATPMAAPNEVGEWVEARAQDSLRARADRVAEIESASANDPNDAEELVSSLTLAAASGPSVEAATDIDIPITQMSSISVTVPSPTSVSPRRGRGIVVLAALAVLGVVAISIYLGFSRAPKVAVAAPIPSQTASAPPVVAAPPASVQPVAAVTVDASPPPVVVRKLSRPAANCDPPYTRSPSGVKTYKRECL